MTVYLLLTVLLLLSVDDSCTLWMEASTRTHTHIIAVCLQAGQQLVPDRLSSSLCCLLELDRRAAQRQKKSAAYSFYYVYKYHGTS